MDYDAKRTTLALFVKTLPQFICKFGLLFLGLSGLDTKLLHLAFCFSPDSRNVKK